MHPRAEEFAEAARERYGFDPDVHQFEAGTRTAEAAARAVVCDVAQIASSLAFEADGELVVVVTSGANRVSESKLANALGVPESAVGMADADRVKSELGWSIGGVPPICHASSVPVYLDETLFEYDEVWAAAGTPEAVFPVAPDRIRELADATPVDVAE
jgi:prolyl-tRNA editing enzyme YbaK/EbsC (Cys-tRNA(Pro) deacylase)